MFTMQQQPLIVTLDGDSMEMLSLRDLAALFSVVSAAHAAELLTQVTPTIGSLPVNHSGLVALLKVLSPTHQIEILKALQSKMTLYVQDARFLCEVLGALAATCMNPGRFLSTHAQTRLDENRKRALATEAAEEAMIAYLHLAGDHLKTLLAAPEALARVESEVYGVVKAYLRWMLMQGQPSPEAVVAC